MNFKHRSQKIKVIFCLNLTIALFLFSKTPTLEKVYWKTFFALPVVSLICLILFKRLSKNLGDHAESLISLSILTTTFIFSSFFMYPNLYLKLIVIGSPFILFSFLQTILSHYPKLSRLFVLVNLAPLGLFFKYYWSPETPFSLWVVFGFLQAMNFYYAITEKSDSLDIEKSLNSQKLVCVFMIVLFLLSWR